MNLQNKKKVVTLGLLLSITSVSVLASGGQRGERRGPPPEAIAACASSTSDQACSFTSRRGDELSGTCIVRKDDETQLACKPENAPERGARGRDEQ